MFGISSQEFIFWLILAAIIIGPSRLPSYFKVVREKIRHFRRMWDLASQNVNKEMQDAFSEMGVEDFNPHSLLGLDDDESEENTFTPTPPPLPASERREESSE